MKYKANSRRKAIVYEKDLVQYWKQHKTFEKSVAQRPADNAYTFYDGPPFITGQPHAGTLLSSIAKDVVPRYWTMKGKRVERVWGWDCHGLPAEVFTEQKLGITDKRDIGTKITLEEYITTCRTNMVQTGDLWETTIDRIGRWVDFKGAYKTMDKEYMESVWWAFKTLYDKGKIYEGEKVLLYCTRDATPISKAEVAMDNSYQVVTDPSVYVKFRLMAGKDETRIADRGTRNTKRRGATKSTEALSYVMGVDDISDDLSQIGVSVSGKTDSGHFKVRVPVAKLAAFEELIIDKLKPGFWNEYLTNDLAVFLFKDKSGKVSRYEWSTDEEAALLDMCNQYANANFSSIRSMLQGNGWYQGHPLLDSAHSPLYLLAWTTTPWTLNANTAIAVNQDVTYAEVELEGERLVVAQKLLAKVFTDEKHKPLNYTVIRTFTGKELVGQHYEPLFADRGKGAHQVWHADFVTDQDGTGIAHEAPAYGEDDYLMAKPNGIPLVLDTDDEGFYTEGPWKGKQIWEHNKQIAKELKEQGVVWKIEYIQHEYPHCHRCHTKLQYRAHPSWFMDIENQKTEMLEQNGDINWFPQHIKHGRFEKTVQSAPDWNLSRDRFWATAMPVWKGKDNNGKEHIKVVGSYAELKELSGVELQDYHRPWIDDVTFTIDGVKYTRVDKVLDCWFESGSMPFAQFHYPFQNVAKFEQSFPGDFIVEYVGQVRAWFYYLHAVNVGLFGARAFTNVITTGTLAGNDGRKMSKSFGNYTDPNVLMDQYSADALRFLLMSAPIMNAEDFSLIDKDVADVQRKLAMVWNMYDFFTMYAEVDGWEWNGNLTDPMQDLANPLDQWIVSRLHQLIKEIEGHMDRYDVPNALKPILPFLDDASNWYVRRSRRRFWKSGDDADKNDAYKTLHYVLTRLSQVLAPFTPFLAEELYQRLTGGESVHLLDWPEVGHVNELALQKMQFVREVINEGLSQRAAAGIKVRQPLHAVRFEGAPKFFEQCEPEYEQIITEELNVKSVSYNTTSVEYKVQIDVEITPKLKREGMMREVIRHVQSARKAAGLNVDDRIALQLDTTDAELAKAIKEHLEAIKTETLTSNYGKASAGAFTQTVRVEGSDLTIRLK